MAGEGEIQRDAGAPEILAALRQLQVDLAATRADIRTLADRGPTGATAATTPEGQAGVSQEVQRTTGALNEEAAARERNISLARQELLAQREITAEVERSAAAAMKLSETRGGAATATAAAARPRVSAATAAWAEQIGTNPWDVAAAAPPPHAGPASSYEKTAPALGAYGEELTNVSARQAEFASAQAAGGAANSQFINQLLRGDVTLSEFGSQLTTTAGKFAQWTAAAGGIFAVIGIFKEVYTGARDSSSGVSQLQRSIDGLNTEKAQADFRRLASELNIPLKDASDAVFQYSRTFPNLDAAVTAASVGLRAQKVDNVELAISVRALTAVHQQFGVSANQLGGVFDLLDEGQRRYNARVGDTLAVLSKSSAAVKDAGGNLQQLIQLATFASRVTGQPGNQIGTAFYRAASNTVQNPSNQAVIKSLGLNPNEAANEFTNFLITAIRTAGSKSNQWKRELAIAIGGKQQGGKVFEPLLSANPQLLDEIIGNVTPAKAQGSTQRELGDILGRTDERVKSLKYDLEQMGAELQRSGAGAGLGLVLLTVTDTLKVTNSLLDAFNVLPHPVKELIVTLLEAKLAITALRATALGSGLASATGLSFLGPSPTQQASRAERAAQESALASVNGLQGSTLVREQQLRIQAAVNAAQVGILREEEATAASGEERLALQERIRGLEAESVALAQEGNLLLSEQAAQQEIALGLQGRINELRAGAAPAGGFFPVPIGKGAAAAAGVGAAEGAGGAASTAEVAALVGGGLFAKFAALPELLSAGLSFAMKGVFVGILADVGSQILGSTVGGGLGKKIAGIGGDVAIGAGIGSVVPGAGTVIGGALGGLAGVLKEELKGEKAQADPNRAGLNDAVKQLTNRLGPSILHAQAGELSPERLRQIHATLAEMLNDPGYERFRGQLRGLQAQLDEVSKGSSDAARALARAKLFNTYQDIAGENPKQAGEHVATIALKATTTGASPANLAALTEELDSLAGKYGGGEDKEGLTALQAAESKLLESSKKNAQDLADKAKTDPNLTTKAGDYRQAIASLDAATASVQEGYARLSVQLRGEKRELTRLEGERASEGSGNAGSRGVSPAKVAQREQDIETLKKAITGNKAQLDQVKKATEYESNQLKLAREQAAESAFTDLSNTIDVNSGLQQAQTTDKSQQLHAALVADNQKLRLAAELFGRNSIQYKRVLTEVLKEQQTIVEQAVTNIDVQGKLEASEVTGTGPNADIARAQIGINTSRQELATLIAGKADPNKIKQVQTQINEAENALAQTVAARARTVNDALAAIKEAGVVDPIAKARIELAAAERDERGLTGTELLQQKATVAQKKADVYQAVTDEKIAQLKYEHDVEKISDNAYISSLEQIAQTRRLSNSAKRQLLQEIHQLQNAGASGLELNVGSIKLPSIYEVRRAIAGGQTGALGSQLTVATSNEFKITVTKGGDEEKVYRAIDRALHTDVRARMRAAGRA